ncbi:hypothetical protein PAPYR_3095 [Paratrimastix pyriformis]|uniref:Dymeclin n=1 Tax=Paratrimastix pyriformis TaxID=342808 RepID=A0ABQ8UMS3_9EUKA|nr:hypothetical protein PAPYR_3095 [Paratrimastix pyriformis]
MGSHSSKLHPYAALRLVNLVQTLCECPECSTLSDQLRMALHTLHAALCPRPERSPHAVALPGLLGGCGAPLYSDLVTNRTPSAATCTTGPTLEPPGRGRPLQPEAVLASIESAAHRWSDDPVPLPLYRYEEETRPDEFFVPYVWMLTYALHALAWHRPPITLFALAESVVRPADAAPLRAALAGSPLQQPAPAPTGAVLQTADLEPAAPVALDPAALGAPPLDLPPPPGPGPSSGTAAPWPAGSSQEEQQAPVMVATGGAPAP